MRRLICILCLVGIFPNSATARTWHILTDGTGDAPTVQAGIDSAQYNDTVLLAPGVYNEGINFEGKEIRVGSYFLTTQDTSYVSQTVIDAFGWGSAVSFRNGENHRSHLTGLTLINGSGTTYGWSFGGGIFCLNSSPSLSYLTIRDCHVTEYGGGISCNAGSSPIISHVLIENNVASEGGGIHLENAGNVIIRDSIIRGNHAYSGGGGISAWGGNSSLVLEKTLLYGNTGGGCIINEGGNNSFTLINVTIANNGYGALQLYQGGYATILNSVLWGNPPNEIVISDPPGPNSVVITNSDIAGGLEGIQGNLGDTVAWLDGNISVDPLFIDAEVGNYHLAQASPCIDAGTSFFEWEDETFIDVRPGGYFGLAPDMGAFELEATSSVGADDSLPTKLFLGQNHPNPFNPRTTINYTLPELSLVNICIYDMGGRLVDVLVESESQLAGSHTITWSGRDADGRALPSGAYFYRLEAGAVVQTKRMTLIR